MRYSLNLNPEDCLLPTPSGAYHAACTKQPERVRKLLFFLMQEKVSRRFSPDKMATCLGLTEEDVLDLLGSLRSLEFVEAFQGVYNAPAGPLEKILPPLLAPLSGNGKTLLSDHQGLYIAKHGFAHETAEELSALGADLTALHERHHHLTGRNLGLATGAWGLLDAAGGSQIGFWPVRIGEAEFNLVVSGAPYLNQTAFRDLIWVLSLRYA